MADLVGKMNAGEELGEEETSMVEALMGLQDAFRARHPSLKAYTFYSNSGAASRLDGVWFFAPLGIEVQPLNAAVLWTWRGRIDHNHKRDGK